MDADQIRRLKPMLAGYLRQFDDCFARRDEVEDWLAEHEHL
jgi:hypothetical protein